MIINIKSSSKIWVIYRDCKLVQSIIINMNNIRYIVGTTNIQERITCMNNNNKCKQTRWKTKVNPKTDQPVSQSASYLFLHVKSYRVPFRPKQLAERASVERGIYALVNRVATAQPPHP